MARKDGLDNLLRCEKITDVEWLALGKALSIYNILAKNLTARRYSVNEEFRHCFGHTIANFMRNKYEPDYDRILKETFEKLNIPFPKNENITYAEIEEIFYNAIIQGVSIKNNTPEKFFDELISVGKDVWGFTKRVKNLSLKDGAVAVAVGLPLAFVNKTFFDTNWPRVISTILVISTIRKRLLISDFFKEL